MNKVLIGLLILAAGAGAYFLLLKKKKPTGIVINQEQILGKWKTGTVLPGDSGFNRYRYDFGKDGDLLRSLNDSAAADSSHYKWGKNDQLVWSSFKDSTNMEFSVTKLTSDSLELTGKDSISILFTRVK